MILAPWLLAPAQRSLRLPIPRNVADTFIQLAEADLDWSSAVRSRRYCDGQVRRRFEGTRDRPWQRGPEDVGQGAPERRGRNVEEH